MSRQHIQFEEEFRDGPPPATSYQAGYTNPQPAASYQPGYTSPQPVAYTTNVPPSQSYVNLPGQKLLMHDLNTGRAPGVGARLALSIISLFFTFIMFLVALGIVAGSSYNYNSFPVLPVAIFFVLIFAVVVIIINVLFNRKH